MVERLFTSAGRLAIIQACRCELPVEYRRADSIQDDRIGFGAPGTAGSSYEMEVDG